MLANAYDPEEVRAISDALTHALREIEAKLEHRLGEAEKARLVDAITRELLDAFDAGERAPDALKRVALAAIDGQLS